ncbi:MAG: aminopeptidase, partial [Bdellovibrionales bacterium]|nr:aminopeptidase [Bdellovibrionales bacterium]
IGNIGTEMYYLDKEGEDSPSLKTIKVEAEDDKVFSDFISRELDTLDQWYKDNKDKITPEKKAERITEIKTRFESEALPKMKTENFAKFGRQDLNNAKLLSFKTYVYDLTDFENAFKHLGSDFTRFVEFCKSLEKEKDPETTLKNIVTKH